MSLVSYVTLSLLTLVLHAYEHGQHDKDKQPLCLIEFDSFMEDNLTISWELPRNVTLYRNQSSLRPLVTWTSDFSHGTCDVTTLTSCICYYENGNAMDSDSIFSLNITVVDVNSNYPPVFRADWVIDSETCLKPSPVDNVTFTSINSRCVNITWYPTVTCSGVLFYETETYRVSYRRTDVDTEWTRLECDQECVDFAHPFTVCGLSPYTSYDFMVQKKRLGSDNRPTGHWSDDAIRSIRTAEDVPSGAPQLMDGGYSVMNESCNESKNMAIRIYWKDVKSHLRNGIITEYQLVVLDTNSNALHPFTTHAQLFHYDVTLQCGLEYNISMRAGTSIGLSPQVSWMVVKSSKVATTAVSAEKLFIPELDVHQQSINVTLTTQGHIAGYHSIVWCEADMMNSCRGAIDWKAISIPDTGLSINRSDVSAPLSMLKVGMAKPGAGITWSKCLYVEMNEMPRPRNFHLVPSYIEDNGVEVAWDGMTCSWGHVQPYVVSVQIHVCPTARIDDPKCSGSPTTYTVDGRSRSCSIKHLKESVIYKIHATMLGLRGVTSQASSSLYAQPQSKGNVLRSRAFITVVLIISSLAMLSAIFFIRKLVKKVKQHYSRLTEIEMDLDVIPDR